MYEEHIHLQILYECCTFVQFIPVQSRNNVLCGSTMQHQMRKFGHIHCRYNLSDHTGAVTKNFGPRVFIANYNFGLIRSSPNDLDF